MTTMSNTPILGNEARDFLELELEKKRTRKAGYVNSGVPESVEHYYWLKGYEAAGGPLNGEPSLTSNTGQPSVPLAPATPVPTRPVWIPQSVLGTHG